MPSLVQELQQKKPFRSRAEEAIVALMRTGDLVSHSEDQLMREHGTTVTQYNVLRILRGAGLKGLPSSEVGKRLVSRVPDMTRLLDRMEKSGLVERRRDEDDRRVVTVRLTAKGLELVDSLDEPSEQLASETLGQLGEERLIELLDLLEKVRGILYRRSS